MKNKAVLLCNLGSPDEPTAKALKPYLTEFLMDPYVIDVNYLLRSFLVKVVIVPRRAHASAEAYEKVWTSKGSPLWVTTKELAEGVQAKLINYRVFWAMRYGNPSMKHVLNQIALQGLREVLVIPLYPQYAEATTESTIQRALEINKRDGLNLHLNFYHSFYDQDFYIKASLEVYKKFLKEHGSFDHYLFSYHGLPERHVQKTDPTKSHCLMVKNCCEQEVPANRRCYRHHCHVNTAKIVDGLGLKSRNWSYSFQSRLGKDEWLKPYTDAEIVRLAKSGVKRLAVFSPAFVADCLETLEEIAMRGAEIFKENGGHTLQLVPALNTDEVWIDNLSQKIKKLSS